MAYGFQIDVSGNTIQVLKQIEAEISKLASQVASATKQMSGNFESFKSSLGEIGHLVIEAFAIDRIVEFGKELLHLTAEFEGFENVIKYSSTGILDASANFDYVGDAITRLHLPMRETMESFSEMQAGFYGTGIEGNKLRGVFEGVAEASSVLHLNPATFSRVTFALKEIGELGTLQARQLRMLAFSLPGSVNLAAQSLGMTMEQMHEGMKKGQIKASDFLPKFAETLKVHFEPGLGNAGNSLISQMNDQKTAVTKMMLEMGESLRPFFIDILQDIIQGANTVKEVWGSITGNSDFVKSLQSILAIVLKLVPIWIAYKTYLLAAALVTKVFAVDNGILTASMGSLTIMTDGTTLAVEGLASAMASIGIGALVIGIGLAVEAFISMNRELDQAADKITNIGELRGIFEGANKTQRSIDSQMGKLMDLDPTDRENLANDIQEQIKNIKDQLRKIVNPDVEQNDLINKNAQDAKNKIGGANILSLLGGGPSGTLDFLTKYGAGKSAEEIAKNTKEGAKGASDLKETLKKLEANQNALQQMGIKPKALTFKSAEGGGAKDGALNTSALSGARGGLGDAKVINIHIDTVQKNIGVKASDLPKESDSALDHLIRAVNNLAYSQGSM